MKKKDWFFIFLRLFFSLFALFLIIYYLYLRVIVKKLPQDLPSENHPIFSVILYTWLVILYLCIIIIPIIIKYRGKKEPSDKYIKIIEKFKKLLYYASKPFIWLYEYTRYYITNWVSTILKIGITLYELCIYHRIIGFCIYVMPRLLAGITLFIDIMYFHKIHNFYYVILLTLITIISNLFFLMLKYEFLSFHNLLVEQNYAKIIDISELSLSEVKNISIGEITSLMLYEFPSTMPKEELEENYKIMNETNNPGVYCNKKN